MSSLPKHMLSFFTPLKEERAQISLELLLLLLVIFAISFLVTHFLYRRSKGFYSSLESSSKKVSQNLSDIRKIS